MFYEIFNFLMGIVLLVCMGYFVWASTMIIEERKQAERKSLRSKKKDN